jgi:hypothetical protein
MVDKDRVVRRCQNCNKARLRRRQTPPVKDVNAYLEYAQWVIEDIKPKVP